MNEEGSNILSIHSLSRYIIKDPLASLTSSVYAHIHTGLVPITRRYKAQCQVLRLWGTDGPNGTLSDCYGHFVK